MKECKKISLSIFLNFFLFLVLPACAATPTVPLTQETVQSHFMFRQWDTKSFEERQPLDTLSVVSSKDLSGDVVILRWNREQNMFKTEVYRQENKPGRRSWLFREEGKSKTLNQQPNGEFFISEIVDGKEGGQRVEVFRLSAPGLTP